MGVRRRQRFGEMRPADRRPPDIRLERDERRPVEHFWRKAVGFQLLDLAQDGILAARGAKNLDPAGRPQEAAGPRRLSEFHMLAAAPPTKAAIAFAVSCFPASVEAAK